MAVFLLKSEHGSAYAPPACAGRLRRRPLPELSTPPGSRSSPARASRAAAAASNYCPNDPVTRAADGRLPAEDRARVGVRASGLLVEPVPRRRRARARTRTGSSSSSPRAITGGCAGGNYCPVDPVTRGADGGLPGEDVRPGLVAGRRAGRPAARAALYASRAMRALVLEDDERLRSLVVRTLGRAGLACDEAPRIDEAEELLELHEYDLLVLDRRLPDGDGLDVCRRARARGFRQLDPDADRDGPGRGRDRGPVGGRRRLPRQALRSRDPRGARPRAAAAQRDARPARAHRRRPAARPGAARGLARLRGPAR